LRYRELLYFLSWRDLLVRYKQTAIGVIWALTQPLLTMIVFTVVFGRIAKLSSGTVPYPLLVFFGDIALAILCQRAERNDQQPDFQFQSPGEGLFSETDHSVSAVMVCFVDFLISAVLLVVLFAWYRVVPTGGSSFCLDSSCSDS